MGLPSHDGTWTAYADDIADKSASVWEATEALQQLEAASAFVGLRLNVAKIECMAKGIVKPRPKKGKGMPVSKQRVAVTYECYPRGGWSSSTRHTLSEFNVKWRTSPEWTLQ